MMIGVGRFQVVVLGMLYVGFATVGRDFMILWMGNEFIVSYYCVLLLAFPTIFEYSQQIAKQEYGRRIEFMDYGRMSLSELREEAKKAGIKGISGMKKQDLVERVGLSSSTVAKMGRGEPISNKVLEKLCSYFKCNVNDIIKFENEKLES